MQELKVTKIYEIMKGVHINCFNDLLSPVQHLFPYKWMARLSGPDYVHHQVLTGFNTDYCNIHRIKPLRCTKH